LPVVGVVTIGLGKMKIGWKCWLKKLCHCEEQHGQKHLGRRGNPVAIQGGHTLATRLQRYAYSNDISFYLKMEIISSCLLLVLSPTTF
jgi:hypothetical protein